MKLFVFALSVLVAFAAEAKTVEVKMLNFGPDGTMVFEPGFVQVALGDSVKFVPTDAGHSVASRYIPEGATSWKGKLGEGLTVTPKKEGVYIFQCDPHLAMAMVGVLQVGTAQNLTAAQTEAAKISSGFVMNKDRLTKLLSRVK